MALLEGTADYNAERVTGETPEPARDAWARAHADLVWERFAADRVTIRDGFFETETNFDMTPEAHAARRYWWANYGQAPDGWPYELAYWVGHRIAEGYVANADDPDQALRDLIALDDPAAILAASPPMIRLYGIRNCDTCKKAMKALDAAGRDYTFVDIRADADIAALAPRWLREVEAAKLVNTRSTTWRQLDEAQRARAASDPASLLADHPTLVKRPVIEQGDNVFVGWTMEVQAALGV
ncbi:Protein YffB [Durusdinium trenchii]|uniref:Protein YffB n=1 Tax=Durusdinium trenchii TaxID=1381693 RepID=A0ABP0NXF4_9DINO